MSKDGRTREHQRGEALRLKPCAEGARPRCCAWPGCDAEGVYRAPTSRERLREYQFLCLDHIREFNRRWDFFAGMNTSQIEAHQRADATWHRPSWRFGTASGPESRWGDPFGLFGDGHHAQTERPQRPPTKAERMMAVLDLAEGFTLDELKARYKSLAKQHHPDLHGGDKAAEERLKAINEAYTFLREQQLYA